jgi:predicted dinucleotide-binding enzyme
MIERMKIGIIGAGEVAVAVARFAVAAGHEVVLSNSGDMARLAPVAAGLSPGASAATAAEAALADVVLLAVPWTRVEAVLGQLPAWDGRILIDATNPFLQVTPNLILDDLGTDTASEVVARLAPGARVVKAFNSVLMRNFVQGPAVGATKRLLLVSGDEAHAKQLVGDLIRDIGFAALDLGSLKTGGKLQQAGGALAGHDLLVNGEYGN